MTISKAALSVVLLSGWTLLAQLSSVQVQPYGFRDIRIGMSRNAFKAKHPSPKIEKYGPPSSPLLGQAICVQGAGQPRSRAHTPASTVMRCDYEELDYDVRVRVSSMFVDGRLALIEVEPPFDTFSCFEEATPPGNSCQKYLQVMRDLIGKLGAAKPIIPINADMNSLRVLRWESDLSVAELQTHMCGPWDGTDKGWSKAISEVLDKSYCGQSDNLSYRQPVMLYLDKESGLTLSARLNN